MDIYSVSGTKVKYVNDQRYLHGNNNDVLTLGEVYTVEKTEVGGFSTTVCLKEFPKGYFNSVCFEAIKD